MSDDKTCPVTGHGEARPTTNRDWWPQLLDLRPLQHNPPALDPMGSDFDYDEAFDALDLEAVKAALAKRPNQAPLLSALQTTVSHQKKRQSQLGQSPEIGTPKAGTWTPMTPNQGDPIHDNYDRAIPMPGR